LKHDFSLFKNAIPYNIVLYFKIESSNKHIYLKSCIVGQPPYDEAINGGPC